LKEEAMPDWAAAAFLPSTDLLELFVRGTVIYLALLVLLRIVGQREAGGLGITDLLVVVLIAEAVSGGLTGDATALPDGLVVVVTILLWSVVVDALAYRSPRFAALAKGRRRTLVVDGRGNPKVMRRELMTDEELRMQLRLHGITDLADVEGAYLEPNGMISVVRCGHEDVDEPESAPAAG
jgi:uncharacterized membrane protein YcaP (DUF421 family)